MSAGSKCSVSGAGTASDSEWGWWFFDGAQATTFSYAWSLMADATTVPGTRAAAAKFIPEVVGPPYVPPQGQIWPDSTPTLTGGLMSVANARMSGASVVNGGRWNTYGVDTFVSADTKIGGPGGSASANCTITDPWEVPVRRIAGMPSVLMVSATLTPLLAPQPKGSSGFALKGSFGEIRLELAGDNTPDCQVRLDPGWQAYVDVSFPSAPGMPIVKPGRTYAADDIRQLFLDQHDPNAPIWSWRQPPPTFTFVRDIPAGVSVERIDMSVSAEDADGLPADERQRRRQRDKVLA